MTKPLTILALDLGSKMGWCYKGRNTLGGVHHFIGSRYERLYQLRIWLTDALREYAPDIVIYERPFCRGLDATRSLWGMAGVVESVAQNSAAVMDVNGNTIKKWVGYGGSKKAGTLTKAWEILGREPDDDNHADAVCIAHWALENMEP